ncbi:MAG: chemosensory pili system protein ChpC [Pseudomonadota bacterium]|nr:chemosensory pili system protein ChpC [Pseudomonadota bacterium]
MLPNSALVEVVPVRNIINVANKPRWMIGYLDWRGNSVPLVAFETINGVRMPSLANHDVRAAVVYSVGQDKSIPFMSFLVQGAPQVMNVFAADIVADTAVPSHPAIQCKALVKGEQVSIIAMEKLEGMIKSVMTH